jgi:hypothetical protein
MAHCIFNPYTGGGGLRTFKFQNFRPSPGISRQFLKAAPWKCIIFTPSIGISGPFGRWHPLCLEFPRSSPPVYELKCNVATRLIDANKVYCVRSLFPDDDLSMLIEERVWKVTRSGENQQAAKYINAIGKREWRIDQLIGNHVGKIFLTLWYLVLHLTSIPALDV